MRVCVLMFRMRAVVPSCPLHVQQQVDQGRTPGSEPPSPSCGCHSYPPWTLVCSHCSEQSPCPGESLSHCGDPMDHSDSPCPSRSLQPLGSGQSQENPRPRRRSREGPKEVLAPCPPASCSCPACPGPGRFHPSPCPSSAPGGPSPLSVRSAVAPASPPLTETPLLAAQVHLDRCVFHQSTSWPPLLPAPPRRGLPWPLRMSLTNQLELPWPAEWCRPEQPGGTRGRGSPTYQSHTEAGGTQPSYRLGYKGPGRGKLMTQQDGEGSSAGAEGQGSGFSELGMGGV